MSYWRGDEGWLASAAFNPSHHLVNPREHDALPVEHLPAVLDDLWDKLHETFEPTCDPIDARVTRLDVARNFTVTPRDQVTLLRGWHEGEVPRATRRPMYVSPNGVPESISAGSRSGGQIRAYDYTKVHSGSPPDQFRVEVEARRWLTSLATISTVADVTVDSIEHLFLDRFTWAGMDRTLTPAVDAVDHAMALATEPGGPTEAKVVSFLGRSLLRQHGYTVAEGNSTKAERRRLEREIGTVSATTRPIRLDPVRGIVEGEVAA